ncbi:radical SAM protein [uncultured Oscillibacter sp.]|uniref:radical SAM protein n=1 Tax=uncultured Oscillibacter sp. TaxID=876091 RepID=UPI002620218A|nr:radical SAM protein [uncultured Oscillibacter sp.]
MKWTNPGHQLDDLGARYLKVKNLYIYGRDKKLSSFLQWLDVEGDFRITYVLTARAVGGNLRDKYLRHEEVPAFRGKRVISFGRMCSELREGPEESVVVLGSPGQTGLVEKLEKIGFHNIFYMGSGINRRDNFIQNFLCVWLMYRRGKLLSHWENFLPTSKCNLNCRGCLNCTGYIKEPKDVDFEDFKENVDLLFSKFDYLYSFHFSGGEPLLAKNLIECIRYLQENYKDRIFEFFVITNGTIVPSEEQILAVKSMNGFFDIDDYSHSIPGAKVDVIKAKLDACGVKYITTTAASWYDLEMGKADNSGLSEETLIRWKDDCNSYLHDFGERRLYACCYQQYAARAGISVSDPENDYIEIADTPKMEILEFRQGYTHKGYVSLCRHCLGLGGHAKKIPPAEQIPKVQKGEG